MGSNQEFDSNAFFLVFYCDVSSTMEFYPKMQSSQTPGWISTFLSSYKSENSLKFKNIEYHKPSIELW